MRLASGAHLTYCSNIHPGESWGEVAEALRIHLPQIRGHLGHTGPFGLGLRLSAQAARSLTQPETRAAFRGWLQHENAYVFTLNGFPYGPFHGTPVKEGVYRPDWSTDERLGYTLQLIDILADLLPPGVRGSISTVPGGFRLDPTANAPQTAVPGLLEAAYHCWQWHERTGVDLCIGLEPEPMCMLETTQEAVAFFEDYVFSAATTTAFAARCGVSARRAEAILRRHLGVCFDLCHAAVEFENPQEGPATLRSAGIRVAKVQVTAGLELPSPSAQGLERLEAFAEDTYLHQVVIRGPSGLMRVLDLPEALERARAGSVPDGPWRVHLHVPVFSQLAPPLRSTAAFVRAALPGFAETCDHLEVETYTWSVLPAAMRARTLAASIAEELRWTREVWQSP